MSEIWPTNSLLDCTVQCDENVGAQKYELFQNWFELIVKCPGETSKKYWKINELFGTSINTYLSIFTVIYKWSIWYFVANKSTHLHIIFRSLGTRLIRPKMLLLYVD